MSNVTVTRLINADIDTVWSQISEVTLVENWHPSVATVDLLSDQSNGVGATQITITMVYDMKLSILGNALDVLVLKGRMSKLLNEVLAGLDHHVMSGELIGKDFAVAA